MKFIILLLLLSLTLTFAFASNFNRLKTSKRLREKQSKKDSQLSLTSSSFIDNNIINNNNLIWLTAKYDTIKTTVVASSSLGFISNIIESYSLALGRNPLKIKIITTGIISALGDILCQTIEMRNNNEKIFDFHRFSVFTSVGLFYIAPLLHWWFNLLNTIPSKLFGTNISNFMNASTMIVIDQSVASFVVLSGFFFFYELFNSLYTNPMKTIQSLDFIEKATSSWKTGLFPTLKANWVFWPFVNFLCFLLIPVKFQLLFSNIMATFWNIYLSKASSEAST